jgi:hypothetical protein
MRRPPGRSRSIGRDAAVALVLALLVALAIVLAVAGRAGGDAVGATPAGRSKAQPLPPGWHTIDRPITGVIYPRQVFAASTYPIAFRHRPRGCGPTAALNQMPAAGVLLQIFEYTATVGGKPVRVPRLPRRPSRFGYDDATYGPFECAGLSYKFVYRQAGRALQAHVWMNRGTVDPRSRAAALRILDRFEPAGP